MRKRVLPCALVLASLAVGLVFIPGCNPQRSQEAEAYRAKMWHEFSSDQSGHAWRAGHEGGND